MESFDFSKLIWGVAIVAYFLIQRKGAQKRGANTQQGQEMESEQEGSAAPVDFETLFRRANRDESVAEVATQTTQQPIKVDQRVQRPSSKVEPSTIKAESTNSKKRVDFDLRKAVIMSEILTPKFKEQ